MRKMREAVLSYSCITYHVRKIIHCPKCGEWVLGDYVYCPKCVERMDRDPNSYMLVTCPCPSCQANPLNLGSLSFEDMKKARCHHFSRRPRGEYVLYIPPDAIVAEYERSKLTTQMFGLTQDEICRGCEEADALGYHSILYSSNARDLYNGMDLPKAKEAVDRHLQATNLRDEVGILKFNMKGIEVWKEYQKINEPSYYIV